MNTSTNSELTLTRWELRMLTDDIKNWRDVSLSIERIRSLYESMVHLEDTETTDLIANQLQELEQDWKTHEVLKKAATFQRYVSKIFITPDDLENKVDSVYNAQKMTEAVIANAQLFAKMKDRIETVSRNLHLG